MFVPFLLRNMVGDEDHCIIVKHGALREYEKNIL
jgi:GMP synthase PP-ATPase subunit